MSLIALIDADLIDGGTRFPNLATMKISAWHKSRGDDVVLLDHYMGLSEFDKVYISKVFTKTNVPDYAFNNNNIDLGGTGFFGVDAKSLPDEIEHSKPDYSIYDGIIGNKIRNGEPKKRYEYYYDYSIGFTTRGCFRKCPFCVNRKYDKAFIHSPVNEFLDESRKYICCLDDNVFACPQWRDVFLALKATGKPFTFRQGLDVRLMTHEKAQMLEEVKYREDVYFAFDHMKDYDVIVKNLGVYREHCCRKTRAYVLSGFDSCDMNDITSVFERIKALIQYKVVPYIMRYESVYSSNLSRLYSYIAAWCNQPSFFKKLSFVEFCEKRATSDKVREEAIWSMLPDKYLNLRWSK